MHCPSQERHLESDRLGTSGIGESQLPAGKKPPVPGLLSSPTSRTPPCGGRGPSPVSGNGPGKRLGDEILHVTTFRKILPWKKLNMDLSFILALSTKSQQDILSNAHAENNTQTSDFRTGNGGERIAWAEGVLRHFQVDNDLLGSGEET